MANLKAPSAYKTVYNGTHGNASRTDIGFSFAATPVGAVVELGRFNAGVSIDELRLVHGALGDGVTLDIGVIFPMDDKADIAAAFGNFNVAAAGTKKWEGIPKKFEHEAVIIATVKGAEATGDLAMLVEYRNRGNGHTS